MGAVVYMIHFALGLLLFSCDIPKTRGLLYPRESETREVRSLDGIWNFVKSDDHNPTQGIREKWYAADLSQVKKTIPMPVPASYNDITTTSELRSHVGTVWYDRRFFIPRSWQKGYRVWIRFGSVHYESYVWINSAIAVKHEFGHLPFEADITKMVKFGQENHISVLCDNALLQTTVPQGKIQEIPNDSGLAIVQSYTFDFFNYAGIHRSVMIYTTPEVYIEDVIVHTDIRDETGIINYKIEINGTLNDSEFHVKTKLLDKQGNFVANHTSETNLSGVIEIENANLWWPYLMHENLGYMYTLEVYLLKGDVTIDVYRQKVGIRTLRWNTTSFLINNKPIYFRGFGRHEDSDIRGKGLDLALLTRDFNLIKWVGANSYRTSHYPYSEESMDFADEQGIMIIDECPSVDTDNYSQALLNKHKSSIEQLIHRDKNHPSVVMWSIANEPRTGHFNADAYFGMVANYTRQLDPTRPVSAAIATPNKDDKAAKHMDILMFNRYNGWYSNPGRLDMIVNRVVAEAKEWHTKHNKPVLMSEYGADTIEGLHLLPAFVWSEEYQVEVFTRHFKAFDILRKSGFFIGELVWNFADFKTEQSVNRVGGNKKGIFTRNRQPKASAHLLRKRYYALGQELDKCQLPDDLNLYISEHSDYRNRSEL